MVHYLRAIWYIIKGKNNPNIFMKRTISGYNTIYIETRISLGKGEVGGSIPLSSTINLINKIYYQ